jgi:hypothetical protein
MNIEDKDYSVVYEQAERRVRFTGQLRLRSPRDYGPILELLRTVHAAGGPLITLDFRDLEMLNSSGIGTFGQFLVEVRKARTTQVKILGSAAKPWQGRTLALLRKIWDQVELVIS